MALVVNSNIASLNAQRQLVSSGQDLDKASERLASGRRINGAADDAAGLAISNRQTSQIRGLDQAVRNANDGISLIQTAEGALDETTNILQRMRELAIQSSNGIYSDTDRATIDAEVQQLKAEVDRIAETTSFNGQTLLDGSLGEVALQVGSNANQTVSFELGTLNAKNLGGTTADVVGQRGTGTLMAGLNLIDGTDTLTINGQDAGDLDDTAIGDTTLKGKLDEINKNISGVEVSAFVEVTATTDGDGVIRGDAQVAFTVLMQDGSTNTIQIRDTGSMTEFVDKLNQEGGSSISASLNDDGRLVIVGDSASTITVAFSGTVPPTVATTGLAAQANQAQLSFNITDSSVTDIDIRVSDAGADAATEATMSLALGIQERLDGDIEGFLGTTAITAGDINEGDMIINGVEIGAFTAGTAGANAAAASIVAINKMTAETGVVATVDTNRVFLNSVDGSEISVKYAEGASANIRTMTGILETNVAASKGSSVADIDVSTLAGAQEAIDTITTALDQINSVRADMGAVTNRLDFTVSNLSNVMENTAAARSRIVDADFASETAQLSRSQVLQQASQAMLAQANARPQQVLSLLQ